jgi:uncharacterized protein (DUF1330 family)
MGVSDPTPTFLVARIPDLVAAREAFSVIEDTASTAGADVLALAPPRDVQVLEPGTQLAAVAILRWRERAAAEAWWSHSSVRAGLAAARRLAGTCVVLAKGVPWSGLPGDFLPTVATVEAPRLPTPPAYMLVEGSVTNHDPIQRYVGLIMPMLRERGGYYVVYATAADVEMLQGKWTEQAFIVSRWPTLVAAQDFWFCERYQEVAIPERTGHGEFHVLLMPGRSG